MHVRANLGVIPTDMLQSQFSHVNHWIFDYAINIG